MKHTEVDTFIQEMEAAYYEQFPKGWFNGRFTKILGGKSLWLIFGVYQKDKISNNIIQNDPSYHSILVEGTSDEGGIGEKLSLDLSQGSRLLIKPKPGSHMAFDSVKTGWRNKNGTPEQVKKHLKNYFAKLRKTVDDNLDNFHERDGDRKDELGI